MKRAVCLSWLCAIAIYAQGNSADHIPADAAGGTLQRGVPASELPRHDARGASGTTNLVDHGGRVLAASKIVYIWWGSQASWPSDTNLGLTALAQGFQASSATNATFMTDIFPQYMRGAGVSNQWGTSLYDSSSAPPTRGPQTSTIVNEACKVIGANGLAPDQNAVYVVLTANFPGHANYCAWHSSGTCNGTTIQVAYMPNTTGVSGCNDPVLACNNYSQGTQSIANVLSHEFSEAITDPNLNAWYDSSGSEIGDKCAWQFQSCVDLTNGKWQLQTEWSNKTGACAQQ